MKNIRKQLTLRGAMRQMSYVYTGDTVIVHIRRREIPCVVHPCCNTRCWDCVLLHETCQYYSGMWETDKRKSFVPIEDVVE